MSTTTSSTKKEDYPPKKPEYTPPKGPEYSSGYTPKPREPTYQPPKVTPYPTPKPEYPNKPEYPIKPEYPSKPEYPPSKPEYPPSKPGYPPSKPEYPPKTGYPPTKTDYPPAKPGYSEQPKYEPTYEPKYEHTYVPKFHEPTYGPKPGYPTPEPQCGKTQGCLDLCEVKKCLEMCCFEITKCNKPSCLPCGKTPVVESYKPPYADKPECAEKLYALKPEYDDPVKHVLHRKINKSLHVWPHCTIGKIWVGENHNYACPIWTGTGVLVGRDLVLTASHTAPWGRYGWWMRFVPAFADGEEPFGSSYVSDIRGYHTSGTTADDFVVCKLYTPLGDTCGWMGTEAWVDDENYTKPAWNMVGYSPLFKNGQVQFFEDNDKIKKVKDDGPFKLFDTKGDPWGWAGGVLWGWHKECPCVIGVLSGGEEHFVFFHELGWAGGPALTDLVEWAWTNWN